MTAKQNEHFRIFIYINSFKKQVDKEGKGFVFIRVASKADRNKNVNVSVYLENGERFKLIPGQIKEGWIDNGMPKAEKEATNIYLDNLTDTLKNYTRKQTVFTKEILETVLYGKAFLLQHKMQRTKEKEIEVKEAVPTELFNQLRKQNGKRKEIELIKSVDENGFEVTEKTEIVIDPLSLEDFPNNFSKAIYNKFDKEVSEEYPIAAKSYKHDKFFWDAFMKTIIQKKLFDQKTKEIVKVDKEIIKQFEKEHGKNNDSLQVVGNEAKINTTEELVRLKNKRDVGNMSTEDIYKKGLWDKNNIFEMFGSIYYDGTTNATYTKIVIRLFEYRERCNPVEHIKHFNSDWLIQFFNYLKKEGWYNINTKNFDPLNYDRSIFFQNKPREEYKVKTINRMIGIIKSLVVGDKSNKTIPFHKRGYISKLDLNDLKKETEQEGTRIEHHLTKTELDRFFWFKFDNNNLDKYQEIFNKMNRSQTIPISIEELETAKKLFVLQVGFGGLRGFAELSTAEVSEYDKIHVVRFFQNKVTNTVSNPLNDYTEKILKPLGYNIPVLTRTNARNKDKSVSNTSMMEQHYRALLQTIGHVINYSRKVTTDNEKFEQAAVKDIFNPYFARKTFGQLLFDELGLSDPEIGLFTGHKDRNQSELSKSYINKKSIQRKIELIKDLKVGKNPYK